MKRGVWHQFGDRSQKLALEQLENGVGVGVIVSVRDLKWNNALAYAQRYKQLGADVLIDQQFYNPDFINRNLESYPIFEYRRAISQLAQISDIDLVNIANELRNYHVQIAADGLIAPAVMYEAGRSDITELNKRLFLISKEVGNEIGIPTYATVMLGRSVTASNQTIGRILSEVTALDCDGWYFGFEFNDERIPSSLELVLRCGAASLTLACTGKPVLYSYAGPMALLAFGFGATGTAIGHSQNLWQFTRQRFEPTVRGGGGDAPPRFFSKSLWGTIIYPDESANLPPNLRSRVLNQSPYSLPTETGLSWSRWDANKHIINVICNTVTEIANQSTNPRENAQTAINILSNAVQLHQEVISVGVNLRDNSNNYQLNWKTAMENLLVNSTTDYDLLDLLS